MTIRPASTEKYNYIKGTIREFGLHTVCAEARCPNITECWGEGTATFMVLGSLCSRGCRFCAVPKMASGEKIDRLEPMKLARVIREWGLNYVVVTSVCRDDLEDQGSAHFANCVTEIRKGNPGTRIELLIPDFRDDADCLRRITDSRPDVIGHNIETVERLTPNVRDRRASYRHSLNVLGRIKDLDSRIYTKSAIMLGIGEREDEVVDAMKDLRGVGVDFLAIGQYLSPGQRWLEVKDYIRPERFEYLKKIGMEMGFLYIAAGPFVRSSYKAGEYFISKILAENGK